MSNTLSVKSKQGDKKDDEKEIGCKHYARKCAFVAPCCSNVYTCRVCHDEKECHEIDRRLIKKIKCLICQQVQVVHNQCENCNTVFGKYYCEECRLFDNAEKGQFHCKGCGLCRIGGRENFFHCSKCDMCLSVKLKGHHKCVEESSRRNCAICLEDLHTSRTDGHIPPCGHLIHRTCFEQCVKTGNYACPTCAESLLNMKTVWTQLDVEVANTPMPDEYKEFYVFVLCRDCHMESKVLFHVIGLKCSHCGSYNTCRTADPDDESNENSSADSDANHRSTQALGNRSSPIGAEARSPVPNDTASPQSANPLVSTGHPQSQQISESSQSGSSESQQVSDCLTPDNTESQQVLEPLLPPAGASQAVTMTASANNRVTSTLTVTLQNGQIRQPPEGATVEPASESS